MLQTNRDGSLPNGVTVSKTERQNLEKAFKALIHDLKALLETRDDTKTVSYGQKRQNWKISNVSNIRVLDPRRVKTEGVDFTKVFDPKNYVFDQGASVAIPLLEAVVSPFRSLKGPPKFVDPIKVNDLFIKHLGDLAKSVFPNFAPAQIYGHEVVLYPQARAEWAEHMARVSVPRPILIGPQHSPESYAATDVTALPALPTESLTVADAPRSRRPSKEQASSIQGIDFRVERLSAKLSSGVIAYLIVTDASSEWEARGFSKQGSYPLIEAASDSNPGAVLLSFMSEAKRKLGYAIRQLSKNQYEIVKLSAGDPSS